MEPGDYSNLPAATKEAVHIDSTIPIFLRNGSLRVRAWHGVVKNLAVDVLVGTSFIDRGIQSIFPNERKLAP